MINNGASHIFDYLLNAADYFSTEDFLAVKKEFVDEIVPKLKELMENVLSLKETKNVPIIVDVKQGSNWGNLK